MKALVVGFGSAGARHTRVLEGLGLAVAVVSRRPVERSGAYATIADAVPDWRPDYVVLAGRTAERRRDMAALADSGFEGPVLAEKPLFDRGTDVPDNSFSAVFVGYNLRFHPVVRRLADILEDAAVYGVHAYVGQYLPDWRPGTDYRAGYSAVRTEGGGVLRDLSHELDFLTWMLGGWTRLTAAGGRVSHLEIDSDDIFSVLFEAARCPVVSVQMNYLDSVLRRQVLALTDRGTVRADLAAGRIEFAGKTESFAPDGDDTYTAEHAAALSGDGSTLCTLPEALDVMRMIEAAETAAAQSTWVVH